MSYHELPQQTADACSQAVFDYHPDCYCSFHFVHADYPPRRKYRYVGVKYLQVIVWRSTPDDSDRYVLGVSADTGPELLRQLRYLLDCLREGTRDDPSLLADADRRQALSSALRHPMLPAGLLLHALDDLAERLPATEAENLTTRLQRGTQQREREAYSPAEGGGWIPSAPPTTQQLHAWPL